MRTGVINTIWPKGTTHHDASQSSLRIAVIAFTVAHNHIARAYALADMLREQYTVQLIAPMFLKHGSSVWPPLREPRVPVSWFYATALPAFFAQAARAAQRVACDVIIVSKPRLPSYLFGILLKLLRRERTLILDIDDYETGYYADRKQDPFLPALTLDEIVSAQGTTRYTIPYGELWTRYCESIVHAADAITVANPYLQQRYGGILVPQARDEHDFDPRRHNRNDARAGLGLAADDRVVLFLGTPHRRKGVFRLVRAVLESDDPRIKLIIAGSARDPDTENELSSLHSRKITLLPDQPFADVPTFLAMADLVCLLPDAGNVVAANQMPAKFADALGMAVPILATEVPALAGAARQGLVELVGDRSLGRAIGDIFADYGRYKSRAIRNRDVFLKQHSYDSSRRVLVETIEANYGSKQEMPSDFLRISDFLLRTCRRRGISVPGVPPAHYEDSAKC